MRVAGVALFVLSLGCATANLRFPAASSAAWATQSVLLLTVTQAHESDLVCPMYAEIAGLIQSSLRPRTQQVRALCCTLFDPGCVDGVSPARSGAIVVVLGILTSTFAVPPSISMSPELWYQQALTEPALWHGGWLERERSVVFQFESLPHPDDVHTRSAGAWVTDHYLALLRSAVDVWDYTAWNADVLFERTGILAEYAPLVPDPAVLDWPAAEPVPDASGAHYSATKLDLYSRDPGVLPPGTRPHLLLWGTITDHRNALVHAVLNDFAANPTAPALWVRLLLYGTRDDGTTTMWSGAPLRSQVRRAGAVLAPKLWGLRGEAKLSRVLPLVSNGVLVFVEVDAQDGGASDEELAWLLASSDGATRLANGSLPHSRREQPRCNVFNLAGRVDGLATDRCVPGLVPFTDAADLARKVRFVLVDHPEVAAAVRAEAQRRTHDPAASAPFARAWDRALARSARRLGLTAGPA